MTINRLLVTALPLIPAAYGGIYRSTFSTLLTTCVYVYILTSMRYTDSFMDGAGAHPPFLLHTSILPVTLCIFYTISDILCILITSPQLR